MNWLFALPILCVWTSSCTLCYFKKPDQMYMSYFIIFLLFFFQFVPMLIVYFTVVNLTLVDLPGLTKVAVGKSP